MEMFGIAWVGFAVAVAIHVTDEAAHDFLSVYNPIVRTIRARVPLLPIPTFTFAVWLGGLIAGIALLFVLSPLAFANNEWLRMIAWPLALIVGIGNGLLHLIGSAWFHKLMPGTLSAPLLLLAGSFLLAASN